MSRNSLSAIEFRNRQNKFLNLTWEEIGNYRILHLTQNVGRNYFWVYLIQDVFVPALYQIFLSLVKCSVMNTKFGLWSKKKLIFTMILICILKRISIFRRTSSLSSYGSIWLLKCNLWPYDFHNDIEKWWSSKISHALFMAQIWYAFQALTHKNFCHLLKK